MDTQAGQDARRRLAEAGVTQVGDDAWTDGDTPERRLTANEVAHSWAGQAFTDERLDVAGQLALAFGLLDLLDDYWVTCEIRFADGARAARCRPTPSGTATGGAWRPPRLPTP
jgi:hypothetical protein